LIPLPNLIECDDIMPPAGCRTKIGRPDVPPRRSPEMMLNRPAAPRLGIVAM